MPWQIQPVKEGNAGIIRKAAISPLDVKSGKVPLEKYWGRKTSAIFPRPCRNTILHRIS